MAADVTNVGLGSPPYYKAHVEAFRALFDAVEDTKRFPDAGVPRGLIPLRVGSKAPTKGRGKDHPALGRGTLRRLCGSKGAVGVVPALLGAFVVDVDTDADSEDYAAASAAVAEFLGRVPHPPVFRNPTGKPGREHLWFRALPEEIEQGAWRYGEVRHNRGYLVVWDPEGLRAAVESERWDATQPVSPAALYALLPAAKASRKAAGRAGTTKEGSRGQAFRPFRLPTEMSVAGAATLLGLDKLRRNGEHHGPCVSCGKGGDTGDRCWLTEVRPHVVVLRNRDAVHADGCECDGEELRQEALSRLTGGKEVRQSSLEIAERVVGASALAYTAESEVWREWTGQSWDALGPLEVERRCSEIGERDGNHGPRVREAARCVPLLLPRNRVLTPGDWDVGWEERGVLPLAGGSGVRLSDGAIVGLEADWLLTLTAGVTREEYEARGDGDVWERLVQEWLPDAGERAAVQRLFGQGLLGNPAQRFVALVGPGGTGKSSFLSGLSVALGGVLGVIPPSFIAPEQRGEEPHPAALVPLERCRVVTSGEVSAAASWRESLVKDISGGDMVMVRGMRENPRYVRTRSLLVAYGNKVPGFRGEATALRRRLVVVNFDSVASGGGKIDQAEMASRLRGCAGEILRWLVAGAVAYRADGLGLPAAMVADSETHTSGGLEALLDEVTEPAGASNWVFVHEVEERLRGAHGEGLDDEIERVLGAGGGLVQALRALHLPVSGTSRRQRDKDGVKKHVIFRRVLK